LCRQAVRRGEIVLRGSGKDARDFVAVTDIVRALELFVAAPAAALGDGVLNIGGGGVRTTLEVAECVQAVFAEMSGRRVPIRVGTENGPRLLAPSVDISRARGLGYIPQVDFRKEVRRTLGAADGPLGENVT